MGNKIDHITSELIDKIQSEWDFAMKEWSYGVPENLEISYDRPE